MNLVLINEKKINTFSASFDSDGYDENKYAVLISKKINLFICGESLFNADI